MTTKHLPNAKHIDQVLADLEAHPDEFAVAWDAVAWDAVSWNAARDAAWYAAGDAARNAAWDAARAASRDAVWNAAWDAARAASRDAVWNAAWAAAWDAAWSAITALVAWDHSSKYLTMTYQELNMWYQLNEDPACALLLTYVRARELITNNEVV
jgi:hypothetical protein